MAPRLAFSNRPICDESRQPNTMLLAPAGTLASAEAAIGAGADAIYVGVKGWSRGGSKSELSQAELRDCLGMARASGVPVHMAANVIPKPGQRAIFLDELQRLAGWGLDAVIVNDAGFLREIRQAVPELPVTISIGCGALNAEDVRFYESLGAAAVVLPGNLEPEEIAEIRAETSIKLELMLHMVQEFTQLGKCWMPSFHKFHSEETETRGRGPSIRAQGALARDDSPARQRLTGSVKRGGVGPCFAVCQQPWRLYRDDVLLDERLLPSRQISRVNQLAAFLAAGVDVIKLQGRSLPVEVLGALVARYRVALDACRAGVARAFELPVLDPMWTVKGR